MRTAPHEVWEYLAQHKVFGPEVMARLHEAVAYSRHVPMTPDYVRLVIQSTWETHVTQKCLELLEMMIDTGKTPPQDVIRVQVNDDGTVDLLDFALPPELEGGRKKERIPQEDVPTWIMEAISMLRIAPEGDLVPGLGFKISDTLYFVSTERGESDEQDERS